MLKRSCSLFGINVVALVDGQPKIINLKEMLEAFIRHRREVLRAGLSTCYVRRVKGLILLRLCHPLANIDEIIALIKQSTPAEAERHLLLRVGPQVLLFQCLKSRARCHAPRMVG